MKIDKNKRDEATQVLSRLLGVPEGVMNLSVETFVDLLIAAIVPPGPDAPPDINDQVPVPDLWLARDSNGLWWQFANAAPKQVSVEWEGKLLGHAIDLALDIPWRESLHKAVNGKWVRWDHVNDKPLG